MDTVTRGSNDWRVPARVAKARLPPLREGGTPRRVALFAGREGARRLLEMVPAPEPPAQGVIVDDPHVLSVRSFSAEEGGWALVEYVGGARLSEVLALAAGRGARLPVRIAVRIVLDACEGLAALHQGGVVHGAISPRALVVGGDGATRVLDPRVVEEREVSAYAAPEQASGQAHGASADVFSIAVVAWEALAGRRLFRGTCGADTRQRVKWAGAPAAGTVAKGLPLAIDLALARALAKEPSDRTGAVRDFASAIGAAVSEGHGIATAEEVAAHLRALLGMGAEARRAVVSALVEGIAAPETFVSGAEIDDEDEGRDAGAEGEGVSAHGLESAHGERSTVPSVPPPTSFAIDEGPREETAPDIATAAANEERTQASLSAITARRLRESRASAVFVCAAAAILAILVFVARPRSVSDEGERARTPAAARAPATPARDAPPARPQTCAAAPAAAAPAAAPQPREPQPQPTPSAAVITIATTTATAPDATGNASLPVASPAPSPPSPAPARPAARTAERLPDNPY